MKRSISFISLLLTASLLLLCACSSWMGAKEDVPLDGKREPVLLAPTADALQLEDATPIEIVLPAALSNTIWSQSMAYPTHNPTHLSLEGGLSKRIWDTSIGAGNDQKSPLLAAPIIVGNMVYALDTRGHVTALALDTGKKAWSIKTRSEEQDKDELSAGGGLAYGRGQVLVTNGSRDLIALNAQDGKELWRVTLDAPLRGAPAVAAARAYVTDAANHITAIDTVTGSKAWQFDGSAQNVSLLGTPAPAIDEAQAVAALSTGTIISVGLSDGQSLWNGRFNLSKGGADSLTDLRDVAGSPIIDQGRVMAVNASGYMIAFDAATGTRLWQKDVGGTGSLWPAGNVVYVMTRSGLSARSVVDGAPLWALELLQFEDEDKEEPLKWYGPYLLSGKLYAFGSAGKAVVIDPVTGVQENVIDIADDLVAPPAVAGNMVVMVSASGRLSAWR